MSLYGDYRPTRRWSHYDFDDNRNDVQPLLKVQSNSKGYKSQNVLSGISFIIFETAKQFRLAAVDFTVKLNPYRVLHAPNTPKPFTGQEVKNCKIAYTVKKK